LKKDSAIIKRREPQLPRPPRKEGEPWERKLACRGDLLWLEVWSSFFLSQKKFFRSLQSLVPLYRRPDHWSPRKEARFALEKKKEKTLIKKKVQFPSCCRKKATCGIAVKKRRVPLVWGRYLKEGVWRFQEGTKPAGKGGTSEKKKGTSEAEKRRGDEFSVLGEPVRIQGRSLQVVQGRLLMLPKRKGRKMLGFRP